MSNLETTCFDCMMAPRCIGFATCRKHTPPDQQDAYQRASDEAFAAALDNMPVDPDEALKELLGFPQPNAVRFKDKKP